MDTEPAPYSPCGISTREARVVEGVVLDVDRQVVAVRSTEGPWESQETRTPSRSEPEVPVQGRRMVLLMTKLGAFACFGLRRLGLLGFACFLARDFGGIGSGVRPFRRFFPV